MKSHVRSLCVLIGLISLCGLGSAGRAMATNGDDGGGYTWPGAAKVHVAIEPDGAGFVQSTPYLLDCPSACTRPVDPGTSLTFAATASDGFVFAGWTGGCSGTEASCTALIPGDTEIVAHFAYIGIPEQTFGQGLRVRLSPSNGGVVYGFDISNPGGPTIFCPIVNCSANFPRGDLLLFFSLPATGFTIPDQAFDGCELQESLGTEGACLVFYGGSRTITANFVSD